MVVVCLVSSAKDVASLNMYAVAVDSFTKTAYFFEDTCVFEKQFGENRVYLLRISQESVYADHIDREINRVLGEIDVIIFLSKHASVSQIPSFCIHTQGNWGKADLGGSSSIVGVTPVVLKNALYGEMVSQNKTDFDVVHEGTHHGPDLKTPCIFFEIGSSETEWAEKKYAEYMISVLFSVLESYLGEHMDDTSVAILGIGGSHTCTNYNRLSAEGKILLGHVAPNYAVMNLTADVITQALANTTLPSTIVVDWKALNSEMRAHVSQILESMGVNFEKLVHLKKRLDV